MHRPTLVLAEEQLRGLAGHLLPEVMLAEEAAFVFAEYEASTMTFSLIEWMSVPADGFESRSLYHLALADEYRVRAIRRAHDLECCLVECHSHAGTHPAEFSTSDLWGFGEFVPHVRWRLEGRPYGAIVFAADTFDAFAWIEGVDPYRLSLTLEPDGAVLMPTAVTSINQGDGP